MKPFIRIYSIAAALLLSACAGQPIQIGQVTDVSKIDRNKGEFLESSGIGYQLFFVVPIATNDRHERAYGDLLAKAGKNRVLTDVSISEWWYYGVLGTFYQTRMSATAYPILKTDTTK